MNPLRKMGLKSWIRLIPEFGFCLPFRLGLLSIVRLLCPAKMINWTFERKHKLIKDFLIKHVVNLDNKTSAYIDTELNNTIWVFWWQGINEMPDIVRLCYQRLCEVNTNANVILVNRDNYMEYVDIPDHIVKKIGKQISITHFSDILRANLLYKYGGIWVDSTLYFIKQIPEEFFRMPFFSIKDKIKSSMSPARHRWTGFFICAKAGSCFIKQFVDCFNNYWSIKENLIDYLLIDYFLDIIYDQNIEFKTIINDMQYTDYNVHCMDKVASNFDQAFCEDILQNNLFIKMSYKGYNIDKLQSYNSNFKHIIQKRDGK